MHVENMIFADFLNKKLTYLEGPQKLSKYNCENIKDDDLFFFFTSEAEVEIRFIILCHQLHDYISKNTNVKTIKMFKCEIY